MTVTVTDAIAVEAATFTFAFRSTTLGVAALLLLLALMFAREMLKAHGGGRARERVAALDIAVWPLFIAFCVIVSVRLIELI